MGVTHDPYRHDYFRGFRWSAGGETAPTRVLFILGSTAMSGGTYVILEHARWLADHGCEVELAAMHHPRADRGWHPALGGFEVRTLAEAEERSYDVAIATFWRTVYELPRFRARHHAYFVQSIESRFYGEDPLGGAVAPLADLTYTFGIPMITIAGWMQLYLAFRHGAPSFVVRNGIRKDLYTPVGPAVAPRVPGRLRVLVEGPTDVPMKNVLSAIRLARAGGADEVWLMGSSAAGAPVEVDRVFERVEVGATPAVYRSCDVLVKLSRVEGMFGPPLEMFHCGGTAVTYDVSGAEEYLESGVNSIVVPMGDEDGVIDAVRALRDDEGLLQRLRAAALVTATRWPDWSRASAEFARYVAAIARQAPPDDDGALRAITRAGRDLD